LALCWDIFNFKKWENGTCESLKWLKGAKLEDLGGQGKWIQKMKQQLMKLLSNKQK
jgi:hypothetical protein